MKTIRNSPQASDLLHRFSACTTFILTARFRPCIFLLIACTNGCESFDFSDEEIADEAGRSMKAWGRLLESGTCCEEGDCNGKYIPSASYEERYGDLEGGASSTA